MLLNSKHFISLFALLRIFLHCSSKPLLNKVNNLMGCWLGIIILRSIQLVKFPRVSSGLFRLLPDSFYRHLPTLISYPGFLISAGLSQLVSFNGWYFNQFDWVIGLVPPLLYIFVWRLVFRINPDRSSNSVVCNFSLSSLLHKTIPGRYVSVQKGYGSVCNFRFVPGFFLWPQHQSIFICLIIYQHLVRST